MEVEEAEPGDEKELEVAEDENDEEVAEEDLEAPEPEIVDVVDIVGSANEAPEDDAEVPVEDWEASEEDLEVEDVTDAVELANEEAEEEEETAIVLLELVVDLCDEADAEVTAELDKVEEDTVMVTLTIVVLVKKSVSMPFSSSERVILDEGAAVIMDAEVEEVEVELWEIDEDAEGTAPGREG